MVVRMEDNKKIIIDIDSVVGEVEKTNIKDIREEAGLSRQEFCDAFKVPYRTLQSWEHETREISPLVKRLMAYVIGMEKMKQELLKQVNNFNFKLLILFAKILN